MSTRRDRLDQKVIYGPLCQKTLKNRLKRELLTKFGFENMSVIADTLVEYFLKIIDQHYVPKDRLKPYQTTALAIDKNQKIGYGKTMSETKLKPVVINLITADELLNLAAGQPLRDIRPKMVARILKEAYNQGGVFSYSDVAILCGTSKSHIKDLVAEYYQTHHPEILPHTGSIFDCGSTLTHKRIIIKLYLTGLLTKQISEQTNHHPTSVDNYLKVFEQVRALYEDGKTKQEICFFTQRSERLIEEYIQIIKELKSLKNEKGQNKQKDGNVFYSIGQDRAFESLSEAKNLTKNTENSQRSVRCHSNK